MTHSFPWPRFEAATHPEPVAGGGLLGRRAFLRGVAALGGGVMLSDALGADDPRGAAMPWQKEQGRTFSGYGEPSTHERGVQRSILQLFGPIAPGNGASLAVPGTTVTGLITNCTNVANAAFPFAADAPGPRIACTRPL